MAGAPPLIEPPVGSVALPPSLLPAPTPPRPFPPLELALLPPEFDAEAPARLGLPPSEGTGSSGADVTEQALATSTSAPNAGGQARRRQPSEAEPRVLSETTAFHARRRGIDPAKIESASIARP
jgi:hypothetical protein